MSRFKIAACGLATAAIVAWGSLTSAEPVDILDNVLTPGLTEEEANRRAEDWTLEQAQAKGWTPYPCFHTGGDDGIRAIEGRRWPQNDPDSSRLGSCVTYSFMPTGVALEMGPPAEGPNTWPGGMPVGSAAAFSAAAVTWESVADVHLTLVTDGGGAWNAGGPAGIKGNIRVGSGTLPGGALAHGYYPPPNGVSAAGDIHFDDGFAWVTSGAAAGPPFDVETVSLHELGHALGLDHVATVPGDIMFPFYGGVNRTPTAGDIGFMTGIYGAGGHAAECSGACCFSRKICGDRTSADCAAQGGTWRGAGTQCPTQNVQTVMHSSGPVVHIVDPSVDCFLISMPVGPSSDCCFATGQPGCSDPICTADVCGILPQCCDLGLGGWQQECADLAAELCGVCTPTVEGCVPGVLIDAWTSSEDQITCHNFGFDLTSPPIPPNFFEPGSQDFFGDVCLIGQPLGSTPFGSYGSADTLILRSDDPFDRCELPVPGDERTVSIEIVALNLQSIAPINVQVLGQPTQWDVFVDLSQVPAPPGQMTATKEHCNGGTYNSILPVQPRFTFTKIAGPGVPPGTVVELDTGLDGQPPIQLFSFDGNSWTNDIDPYLNLAGAGEGCSGFHPGVEDPNAAPACDCNLNLVRDDCDIESNFSSDCNANGIPDECDPDADGDGIPDDCDSCPDTPGMLCPSCTTLLAARSCNNHGLLNRQCLDILANNIEPRLSGVTSVEIDVDAGSASSASISCVNSGVYAGSVSILNAGGTIRVDMIPALPDGDACTITLDCGASLCVRGLAGDIDRNGIVSTGDASIIKPHFGQNAATAGAEFDFDQNDIVSTGDASIVKPRFGNSAPACP